MKKKTMETAVVACGIGGACRIEIEKGAKDTRILVSGAEHVCTATEEEISFSAHGERISIRGTALRCFTYEGGVAEVGGRVFLIAFSEEGAG